jgi:transposase-like protein
MPEYQPVSSAHIAAIERPRCPDCRQDRMLLSKHEMGRSGCGTSTFECRKCGRVQTVVASGDPMRSRAKGWLAGELKPPK